VVQARLDCHGRGGTSWRGAQEKTFGELKGEFAVDVVPTNHYGANSAWMQLSILAHNLIRSFQIHRTWRPETRARRAARATSSKRSVFMPEHAIEKRVLRRRGAEIGDARCAPTA
jgi:hypothetical protein